MNRIYISGFVTYAEELKYSQSGKAYISFRLSAQNNGKNFYVSCITFGAAAEYCSTFLKDGRYVAIEGRLEYKEWLNQNGEKRSKLYITCYTIFDVRQEGFGAFNKGTRNEAIESFENAGTPDDDW